MADSRTQNRRTIKSLGTALEIVDYIHQHGTAGVTEIANHVGVSKSTASTHLSTLEQHRYLVRDGDKYRIGLKFLTIGGDRSIYNKLFHVSKNELDELAAEVGETVQLGVEEHGIGVYIYQSRSEKAVRTDSDIGSERALHSTSFGKAILAHLPEERVNQIVDRYGLQQYTPDTVTDRDALFSRLDEVRERGYAFDDEEQIEGIRCVGVPIFNDDDVVGAVSVTGPKRRIDDERFYNELPEIVLSSVRIIEINLENS